MKIIKLFALAVFIYGSTVFAQTECKGLYIYADSTSFSPGSENMSFVQWRDDSARVIEKFLHAGYKIAPDTAISVQLYREENHSKLTFEIDFLLGKISNLMVTQITGQEKFFQEYDAWVRFFDRFEKISDRIWEEYNSTEKEYTIRCKDGFINVWLGYTGDTPDRFQIAYAIYEWSKPVTKKKKKK